MLTERIIVAEEDFEQIEDILTEADIDYDWDNGDRLMVSEYDLAAVAALFDDNGIDYDIV